MADTLSVTAAAPLPDTINAPRGENVSVRFSNGRLTVSLNKNYSGMLALDVYDMMGRTCYQRRLKVDLPVGKTVRFDLSALPSQLYIAHVRTKDRVLAIKFVK